MFLGTCYGTIAPTIELSLGRKSYLSHFPAFETICLASCPLSSVIFEAYNKRKKDNNRCPLRVFLGQYYKEYKNIQDPRLKEFIILHRRRKRRIYRD